MFCYPSSTCLIISGLKSYICIALVNTARLFWNPSTRKSINLYPISCNIFSSHLHYKSTSGSKHYVCHIARSPSSIIHLTNIHVFILSPRIKIRFSLLSFSSGKFYYSIKFMLSYNLALHFWQLFNPLFGFWITSWSTFWTIFVLLSSCCIL